MKSALSGSRRLIRMVGSIGEAALIYLKVTTKPQVFLGYRSVILANQ